VLARATFAKEAQPAATAETQVSGVLLGANQQAEARKLVLLIKVRLLDLMGKEVRRLPKSGGTPRAFIIDALVTDPVAVTHTDSTGAFAFKAVQAGRYCLGATSKPDGAYALEDVALLKRIGDTLETAVFDLASGQDLRLGSLSRKPKQE
jgi:hypothetical protein